MDKTSLQILLSRLSGFNDPDPELEQYTTPPSIAADLLNRVALSLPEDSHVADLGCGTGILSIGAAALGLDVTGVDTDEEALETARDNLELAEEETGKLDVTFLHKDVDEIDLAADAVITNPPFGLQQEDANLTFLQAGFDIADDVYALMHRSETGAGRTRKFIKEFASKHGFDAEILETYRFPLPRTMAFHQKERADISVDLYHFSRC